MKTKILYRDIMSSVSKEVKRALLEAEYSNFDFDKERKGSISRIEDREEEEDELTWKQDIEHLKYIEKQKNLATIISKVLNDENLTSEDKTIWYDNVKDIEPFYAVKDKRHLKDTIEQFMKKLGNRVNLNWMDTSNITDMSRLFYNSSFDGNISKWDVSNVKDMSLIFESSTFNGDISQWNVSRVNDMNRAFTYAVFDKDISNWDVSSVTDMGSMFENAEFNQDISKWDVSNVKNMSLMFEDSKFNGDISNWDVSNVKDMWRIFARSAFKKDISTWKISDDCDVLKSFDDIPKKYRPKTHEKK